MEMLPDRVGISWRGELAAGVLRSLDRIDVVELIADDYFAASGKQIRALQSLGREVPILLHGVGLGPASASPVKRNVLDKMAWLVERLEPEFWSEHLAFVRAGDREIGHLAAPPRTAATVEGAASNLDLAQHVVGSAPLVENIATLIDPPGSTFDEPVWISRILVESGCDLLLDLHNVYANAANFGFDPHAFLDAIPMERVGAIHLAGGRWIEDDGAGPGGERRLLDDHLHPVPDPVYELLADVALRSTRPLTVILERDGRYPDFPVLLRELDAARNAIRRGRAQRLAEEEAVLR
jgi:uncharacterized protein